MTYNKNIPNELFYETLFANGVCLTYDPLLPLDNFKYAKDLEKEYSKQNSTSLTQIETPAILTVSPVLYDKFHYFSNGILIYNFFETENKDNVFLKRILKMFEIRKLPVNKIYDLSEFVNYIEASKYMNDLQQYALKFYSFKDNIKITALPSVDDFVKECFANGNILLTACKDIDIPSNFRDDIALFVDGRIYVSKYCGHLEWAYTIINERILKKEHRDFVFLQTQYIPKSYIMALNEEAKKYSWYISKEEQNKKSAPSSDETDKMNKYIEDLFSNRKCLSVTNIKCDKSLNYFSAYPDTDKYALFSDGLLLISNKSPKSKFWFENISKVYKDLEFKIELVPDYYITAIYSNLHKYQRCATDIYMEMLKKQAKKIKKELKVAHYEALEIVARSESWKDYKSINIENESIARYLISRLLQYTPDHSTEYYARIYQKYLKEKGGNND